MMRKMRLLQYGAGVIASFLVAALPCAGTQTYSASGLVVNVSPGRNEVVVSMQEIPGIWAP